MNSLGRSLGNAGLTPNLLTLVGFCFSVLAGLLYGIRPSQPYFGATMIAISGLFDVLDGAAARATGRVSKRGSFTDSTIDRVAEVAIYSGIIYGGYQVSALLVLLTLSFSLLVSYVRAKSESLNIAMRGIGIGERAERLLALVVFSVIGYVWIGVSVVLILAAATFVQRYIYAIEALGSPTKHPS